MVDMEVSLVKNILTLFYTLLKPVLCFECSYFCIQSYKIFTLGERSCIRGAFAYYVVLKWGGGGFI